jgi:hypothetical protein
MSKNASRHIVLELLNTVGPFFIIFVFITATVYWLTGRATMTTLRILLCLAFYLLPVVFIVGLWLGLSRSKAKIEGLQFGVDQVMDAAGRTADLRTATVGAVRSVMRQPTDQVQVVKPVIEVRRLEAGDDDVVLL